MHMLIKLICLFSLSFSLTLSASSNFLWQQVSSTEESSKNLPEYLIEKAHAHYEAEEYKEAIEQYVKAIQITDVIKYPDEKALLLLRIGRSYQRLTDYPNAQDYFAQFLHLAPSTALAHEQGRVLGYLASIYNEIGDFEKSMDYQLKALRFSELNKDSLGIARSLYDLGTLFYYQEKYETSLKYYRQSMTICERLDNKKSLYSCNAAIGSAYLELDSLEKALEHNFKSLEIAKRQKIRSGEGYAINNIGANYLALGQFDLAQTYLDEAIKIQQEVGDIWGQIGTLMNLGDLAIEKNQINLAIYHFQNGLELSKEIHARTREVDLYELLANAYQELGEFQQANTAFKKHISLKDELVNEKSLQALGARKTQYEIQKRENEIKLLKKENELLAKDKEIKILYDKYFSTIVSVVILLSFLGILLYRIRSQKRMNRKLEEKNNQIYQQNKQLEFTNGELKKFAYIASHDLKAPLRSIGSFTGLLRRRYGRQFDSTAQEYMQFIIDGAKRMDQLLNDLLAYSNIEKLAYSKDKNTRLEDWLDTRSSIREALANLSYSINEHKADIHVNERAMPRLRANPTHMTQLFQNIIANGIKFKGLHTPAISIDCKSDDKMHTFSIQDNGIGIESAYKDKIFEMFSRLNGVEDYEGTGIGLATCKKIIEHHGGEIWVESELGKGSTFFFTIPVKYSN